MDIPPQAIFLGILLAIPLQMCFSPEKSSDMDYYLKQTMESLNYYWKKLKGIKEYPKNENSINDEIVDFDENEKEYFGLSTVPRNLKPPNVKFSVGDIVVHKRLKHKGVIIGWDEAEKAPERWLKEVRGPKEKRGPSQPNYAVLIDTRLTLIPQMGYILQENLELAEGKVIHPLMEKYFEKMENVKKYKMRPILRNIYPND